MREVFVYVFCGIEICQQFTYLCKVIDCDNICDTVKAENITRVDLSADFGLLLWEVGGWLFLHKL